MPDSATHGAGGHVEEEQEMRADVMSVTRRSGIRQTAKCFAFGMAVHVIAGGSDPVGRAIRTAAEWDKSATTVASASQISICFNNTRVGARDSRGVLHAVYASGPTAYHATFEDGVGWKSASLPSASGVAEKPTFAITSGAEMLVAWGNRTGRSTVAPVVLRSADYGATWSAPLQVAAGGKIAGISLTAFKRSNGKSGAAIVWHDAATGRIQAVRWTGGTWSASSWTAPVTISTSAGRDPGVASSGDLLITCWEHDATMPKKLMYAISRNAGATWSAPAEIRPNGTSMPYGGQDPSLAFDGKGRIYVAYQAKMEVRAAMAPVSSLAFTDLGVLGPGLFGHAAASGDSVGISWEHFQGDGKDDSIKTYGLALSTNRMSDVEGPHAMPGSSTAYWSKYSAVLLSTGRLDCFWVRVEGSRLVLKHRGATL